MQKMTRESIKTFEVCSINKTSRFLQAKSFNVTDKGVTFWDITGNIEVGFVPRETLLLIKIVSEDIMQKWEYEITRTDFDEGAHPKVLALHWNDGMGNEGWELVAVDNGIAYFKRPIDETSTIVKNLAGEKQKVRL